MNVRTLAEIAELCGATLEGDGSLRVVGPASLADAGPEHVSFLAQSRYAPQLATTRAGAVIVRPDIDAPRADMALLRSEHPNAAFTEVIRAFATEPDPPVVGVHPSAVVQAGAEIGAGVSIGPGCVVEPGAEIGAGCVLVANVYVGANTRVGAHTVLHPGVVLYRDVRLGERCIVHANVVIGADGFGFEPTAEGWEKIPQCGTVEIGDDVELGAATTIDRARFGATRVDRGAKIDNMVQVGHNCVIEQAALVCAQSGLAGSSRIGERVVLGAQVGVNGHLEIGAGSRVAGTAIVHDDLEAGGEYLGIPARPRREAMRILIATAKLPKILERLRKLEQRLAGLDPGPSE